MGSNSLEFPKPAGPRPGTRLAGYKPKGVIHRLYPSYVAMMLLLPGQWRRLASVAQPEGYYKHLESTHMDRILQNGIHVSEHGTDMQ